jgi:hypothetical protein
MAKMRQPWRNYGEQSSFRLHHRYMPTTNSLKPLAGIVEEAKQHGTFCFGWEMFQIRPVTPETGE